MRHQTLNEGLFGAYVREVYSMYVATSGNGVPLLAFLYRTSKGSAKRTNLAAIEKKAEGLRGNLMLA